MGGWDQAKIEATAKATQFCERSGQQVAPKRMAAIKKCTDGIKFNSDRYVACMSKEGESP
jgi:hypothetical protein